MKQVISKLASAMAVALAAPVAPADKAETPLANGPMMIGGGALDPAFPGADIFLVSPKPPKLPHGKACAVAKRYVHLINAGDFSGVAALFADDATLLDPMRPNLQGRVQIVDFYRKRIGQMRPNVLAVTYLGDDKQCMVTLARQIEVAGASRYVLASVDHFILARQGRIASMVAFARPPRSL